MKKLTIIMIALIIIGSWSILSACASNSNVKAEFTAWLETSTIIDIDYSDVDKIIEQYDDDYIRNVMQSYCMPVFPTGDIWYDFEYEHFPMVW